MIGLFPDLSNVAARYGVHGIAFDPHLHHELVWREVIHDVLAIRAADAAAIDRWADDGGCA